MQHLDLFSGIGGFALAARNVGWDTIGFCEIDPYCQKVLAKHWPGVPIHDDIETYTGTAGHADIVTGGFPCQDISLAGKRTGIEGERSGLWTELCRVIGEVRPRYAVLENVSALLSGDSGRWFQRVLGDLAEIGYDCEWHCIPASSVGAPHRRDRVWIIAYPSSIGICEFTGSRNLPDKKQHPTKTKQRRDEFKAGTATDSEAQSMADTNQPRSQGLWQGRSLQEWCEATRHGGQDGEQIGWTWAVEPDVGQLVDGLPARLAGLRGLTDDQRWLQIPCEKTAEELLRDLRKHKAALRASHGQGLEEQRPIEFEDAVQFLSYVVASCSRRFDPEERETAVQVLRENVLSSGNVQHASDQVEAVWQSIDDTAADWFILATCLGRDWTEMPVGRVANGVPRRVDRLRGLGNAIVPQVAEVIFEAINEM